MPLNYIYEMPVYDGRIKDWRILNITTGTVYSSSFPTHDAAYFAIEADAERAGAIVQRINRDVILSVLPS